MDLTADRAAALLARIRPDTPVERTRKELARELVKDIRRLDARLTANKAAWPTSSPSPTAA
jgi:transposase